VGTEHGADIITAVVTVFGERKFRRNLKMLIDIAIIYYITEFMHLDISIFGNTAVTNIRKYQTYVMQVCTVGQ
jgi:hypothetical protein